MQPYIKDHGIGNLKFKYFDNQATQWYDPIKPYTKLEYDWVVNTLDLEGQVVFDVGAHHGNYSVVFKGAKSILCFEMESKFKEYIEANLKLNSISDFEIHIGILSDNLITSDFVDIKPDIYKIDIEGFEFKVLPLEIIDNQQVHTWIVEVHPGTGNRHPDVLVNMFLDSGYKVLKVDRESLTVREYILGETWRSHATIIAVRDR